MLDKQMRRIKENVLTPIARHVGEHISPAGITITGAVIGLASAGVAWQGWYAAGLGLWLANRVLDGLDGTVARLYNKQSDIGAYLDIMVDFVIYAAIPVGLALSIGTASAYIALSLLLASFYVNSASWMYLSSLLEKRKQGATTSGEMTGVTMPAGLIEGTETIIFYTLFFLFPQSLTALFLIMTIPVIITIAQRILWALNNLD